MDPKFIATMESIIKQQLSRLGSAKKKFDSGELVNLADKIKVMAEVVQAHSILITLMGVVPRQVADRYEPHMGDVKNFVDRTISFTVDNAAEIEDELQEALDMIDEQIPWEEEEPEITDVFGRKVPTGVAGLRRVRRTRRIRRK
jgi:hypothetical protein